ncbi:MAG: hydrogenase nickel incorporation protein HypB [Chloroflexota bacterium]|nr:hydrogenase nickel incorporation protein HypB [Chloroflexota bacterium]
MEIKVLKDILSANDQIAAENRRILDGKGVPALNLMSTPGAGKTSLILKTIKGLEAAVRIGVIEGDVQSSIDAERIAREGIPVLQINTGGECHLDANMLQRALNNMPLDDIDLLLVENVGNLVCTAEFALGTHKNVVLASVPEGDDKPLKYPLMFTVANVVVVNKVDLLPYAKFDTAAYRKSVKGLNDKVEVIEVSCTTGEGIDIWLAWLREQISIDG